MALSRRCPFQCLAICRLDQPVLLCANGGFIHATDLADGSLMSTWPVLKMSNDFDVGSDSSTEIITMSKDGKHRSRKRRKLTGSGATGDSAPTQAPAILQLVTCPDEIHFVATTGEDKCIHVFRLDNTGKIEHLSQRRMPKRPCALAITTDGQWILCGDKFGDVYALPVKYTPKEVTEDHELRNHQEDKQVNAQLFKPSASTLTVHTARNLQALENQLRHTSQSVKPKDSLDFEHELLLGHVSMLTDIVAASIAPGDIDNDKKHSTRNFVLTADRDEHIRVSRSRPQAHIIENYCLGHTEFITKLCLARPTILVSGGGDDHLFVWDWVHGRLLRRLPIGNAVRLFKENNGAIQPHHVVRQSQQRVSVKTSAWEKDDRNGEPSTCSTQNIAVSGIWTLPHTAEAEHHGKPSRLTVFCAVEAVPAIFRFTIKNLESIFHDGSLKDTDILDSQAIPLPRNPITLAIHGKMLLVSIDNLHQPWSTARLSPDPETPDPRILAFHVQDDGNCTAPGSDEDWTRRLEYMNQSLGQTFVAEMDKNGNESSKKLSELLYGVENLRKRGGFEDD